MNMPKLFLLAFICTLFVACDIPPPRVDGAGQVDTFIVQGKFKSACVGLKNKEDDQMRRYTAVKLVEYPEEEAASECLCNSLYDSEMGEWDSFIASGIKATKRDDLALCLAEAMKDTSIEQREGVVTALGSIHATAGYQAIAEVSASEKDPYVKEAMALALRSSEEHVDLLITMLTTDKEPKVRAAAAKSLRGRKDAKVISAIVKAVKNDDAGEVRASALSSMNRKSSPEVDEMMCKAMLDDPDEAVRLAAVKLAKGTKRKATLECLSKKSKQEEESGAVRSQMLETLKASPSPLAADILCDAIGPWSRMYIKDKIFNQIAGSDIVKAHNDRDWERSYQCVQRALNSGGYSCFARNYLGHWMNTLGGSAATPWCPGMVKL